ncbi:hypothetical protein NCC49_002597 [Naganishia albida]|nr:hypothetical protein NCC49_002597 [Naganishia albida]
MVYGYGGPFYHVIELFAIYLPDLFEILESVAFDMGWPVIWMIGGFIGGMVFMFQSAKKKDPSLMRLSRDHVSLEARLANMMSFWALWHVAWVVKSIPFFKLTVEQIAPKYLLGEMVVMLFCLNCWFVPAGAPPGVRVGFASFAFHQVCRVLAQVCGRGQIRR